MASEVGKAEFYGDFPATSRGNPNPLKGVENNGLSTAIVN
jgi:hypothetical protein